MKTGLSGFLSILPTLFTGLFYQYRWYWEPIRLVHWGPTCPRWPCRQHCFSTLSTRRKCGPVVRPITKAELPDAGILCSRKFLWEIHKQELSHDSSCLCIRYPLFQMSQDMAHFIFLCFQIEFIEFLGRHFNGDPFDDFDAKTFQTVNLEGIVGKKP